jgi:hypothetical protein
MFERQGPIVVGGDGSNEHDRGGVKRTFAGMSYVACKFVRPSTM